MTGNDERIEVRAPPGRVEVRLPEARTTGYEWSLVGTPPGVRETGWEYEQQAPEGRVGGAGTRVFVLDASPGRYELEFRLQRPWEAEPLERRVVTLVVTDEPDGEAHHG
ncbi:MAG: protease inhibitor I42 family protein [Actinomycetota bacterium]|nr:protease inhibitor I42 family protein [Actinomycetota bacterium]